jgi:hypothetical protein
MALFPSDLLFYLEDRGSTSLQNIGKYLPDYMASHPEDSNLYSHCNENFILHRVALVLHEYKYDDTIDLMLTAK